MGKISLFTILVLFSIFFLPAQISALIVSPDMREISYSPGETYNLHFTVSDFGEDGIIFEVEGENANETVLLTDISNCKSPCGVNIQYKMPYVNVPGKHEIKIKFKEAPPQTKYGQPGISAVAQIISPVYFIAPYPNKYLAVKVHTKDKQARFQAGEKVYFVASVKSYGKETINSITGMVEIRSSDNTNFTIVSLTPVNNLLYDSEAEMYAEWDSSNFKRGEYIYAAKIDYDGEKADHSWSLELGEELVSITALSPLSLNPGEINKIDATLENYWNVPTKTHIQADLLSVGGPVLATAESSTIEIEAGRTKNMIFYLDLKAVLVGNYTLQTETFFGADKSTVQEFNVSVAKTEEKTLSENNEAGNKLYLNGFVYLILVIILLALGALVYFVIFNKKEEEEL